jgi:hypothetical protein
LVRQRFGIRFIYCLIQLKFASLVEKSILNPFRSAVS